MAGSAARTRNVRPRFLSTGGHLGNLDQAASRFRLRIKLLDACARLGPDDRCYYCFHVSKFGDWTLVGVLCMRLDSGSGGVSLLLVQGLQGPNHTSRLADKTLAPPNHYSGAHPTPPRVGDALHLPLPIADSVRGYRTQTVVQ